MPDLMSTRNCWGLDWVLIMALHLFFGKWALSIKRGHEVFGNFYISSDLLFFKFWSATQCTQCEKVLWRSETIVFLPEAGKFPVQYFSLLMILKTKTRQKDYYFENFQPILSQYSLSIHRNYWVDCFLAFYYSFILINFFFSGT